MEKYFAYLEELRKSGKTNMYGAVPFLQDHFPDLRYDRERAAEVLDAWIRSYTDERGEKSE